MDSLFKSRIFAPQQEVFTDKGTLNFGIGKRIRSMREHGGYTEETLAEYADISLQFLADIGMGRNSMTTHTLYKISTALHVTTDYIIYGRTVSPHSTQIVATLETLSDHEKDRVEKLLQIFLEGLSTKNRPMKPLVRLYHHYM